MSNPDNQCGYCFEYHGKHKPECHAGTLGRIIFGSTQQNNRADTPNISKSSVCIECDLRQQRIATLETQLAKVTADRDEANDKALRVVRGEFGQICSYCGWEGDRNGSQWEELQAHIRVCSAHPMRVVEQERDALRTALRTVVEALQEAHDDHYRFMSNAVALHIGKAIALPLVQAVLGENSEIAS